MLRIQRLALDADRARPVVAFHRAVLRQADALHAGNLRQLGLQALVERGQPLGRVAGDRRIDAHDQASVGLESEVLVLQRHQAAREQTRADDEHERDGDLKNDEPLARQRGAIGRRSSAAAQRVHRIGLRHDPRGHRREDRRGEERHHHGESENRRRRRRVDRNERRAAERGRDDDARAEIRDEDARRAAGQREHEPAREHLADEPPPARAERRPHRELKRLRAREQQVREIRAGNEQDERRDHRRAPEGRPRTACAAWTRRWPPA